MRLNPSCFFNVILMIAAIVFTDQWAVAEEWVVRDKKGTEVEKLKRDTVRSGLGMIQQATEPER